MKKPTIWEGNNMVCYTSLMNQLETVIQAFFANYGNDVSKKSPIDIGATSRLLDVTQAAILLNLTKGTLYQKISKSEIPYYKKGRKVYFDQHELESWALDKSNRVKTNQEIELEALFYSNN